MRRTWKRLLDGHCGIVNVKDRDARFADLPCQIAAVVPSGQRAEGRWMASEWLSKDVSMCLDMFVYSPLLCQDRLEIARHNIRMLNGDRMSARWRVSPSMRWLLRRRR